FLSPTAHTQTEPVKRGEEDQHDNRCRRYHSGIIREDSSGVFGECYRQICHGTRPEEPIAPADQKSTELTICPTSINVGSAVKRQHCAQLSVGIRTGESIQTGDYPCAHDQSAVAELGRDAPWNPQNANSDCSADAYRDAKSHSENAKQPFFAKRARISTRLFELHAFGLSDSAPHNKSTGPGHAGLDFALPSVQLAVSLLAKRESKPFPSRAQAAQRLQSCGRVHCGGLGAFSGNCPGSSSF